MIQIQTPDMKVLRKDAYDALRFFNLSDMNYGDMHLISMISGGKLIGVAHHGQDMSGHFLEIPDYGKYEGKTILVVYTGRPGTPHYSDRVLLSDVFEVTVVDGSYLSVSGFDESGSEVECLYKIQDEPDAQPRWVPEYGGAGNGVSEEPKKPVKKPAVKKSSKAPSKTPKKGVTYEVRVNGAVQGSFSSKAKAEAYKKELKAKGLPARIYGVRE